MAERLRAEIADRLVQAEAARRSDDVVGAWELLAEAHILSQSIAWPHIRVHLAMFGLAVRTRDVREVVGQAVRVVVAGPGSLAGKYPLGNTGRSDVSMFEPMPITADLQRVLSEA